VKCRREVTDKPPRALSILPQRKALSRRCSILPDLGLAGRIARAAEKQGGASALLKGSGDALPGAEECFQQALDWAGRDGTLAWELRAAISLARLRRDQEQQAEARDLLAPIYERFTEGFGTADLREAKRLIYWLS
jgi:hypothetical protein